jgi:nitrite reductase (NO-forming)
MLAALFLGVAPRAADAAVVPVHLTARVAVVRIAPGVKFRAWTFNGAVPGPVIRATQGDTVEVTLTNADRKMWHSIDFHAAQVAPDVAFKSIAPGDSFTFSFVARNPGVFVYHCGTSPMLEHIGMGMYGAIIVDPAEGRPQAQEITLVQSEFYGSVRKGRLRSSYKAIRNQAPRFVAFNGNAERYVRHPIPVPVGQPVRIYFLDAGPSLFSAFHVVGTIFDAYQHDGNPSDVLHGVSTQVVPPGGGAVFELTFPEAGVYPFVSHSMRQMALGAMGRFAAE